MPGSTQMASLDAFFEQLDSARLRRLKELSDMKHIFLTAQDERQIHIASKFIVVMSYANWEGFYNECVDHYVSYLSTVGGRVRDFGWMLLVSAFQREFDTLRDRNHNFDARKSFVRNLQDCIDCNVEQIDKSIIMSRSNLNFKRLQENFEILNFCIDSFQAKRNKIDKELVGWRHSVAHGDDPDLSELDVDAHINLTSELILTISDCFQLAALEKSGGP